MVKYAYNLQIHVVHCIVSDSSLQTVQHSLVIAFIVNVANNYLTVNARSLIFDMSISSDKTFSWVLIFLLGLLFNNFRLVNYFSTVRALLILKSIPCEKIFLLLLNLLNLTLILTIFIKRMALAINKYQNFYIAYEQFL